MNEETWREQLMDEELLKELVKRQVNENVKKGRWMDRCTVGALLFISWMAKTATTSQN